jgi:hypothetical protein
MTAQHGGRRTGAGRKPGSLGKATIERDARAAAALSQLQAAGVAPLSPQQIANVTPLDVLLIGMRQALLANNVPQACVFAKDAAPFCHPKLANVLTANVGIRPLREWSDGELSALLALEDKTIERDAPQQPPPSSDDE